MSEIILFVDGSEIPFPTTWDGAFQPCKSWDKHYQPPSTGDRLAGVRNEPSSVGSSVGEVDCL